MSLVGQTVAVLLRNMMLSQTWAESRVLLQPIDPISAMVRDDNGRPSMDGKPYIAVYTDNVESNPVGLEFQSKSLDVTAKVVVYIPPRLNIVRDEIVYEFDNQGAGLALSLIGRQIEKAFHVGNTAWVSLFRQFVKETKSVKRRYLLIELEGGARIPAAEITFEFCKVVPEPLFGKELYGYWKDLDTQLRLAGAEGVKLADLYKTAIEAPSGMPEWRQFRELTNLTEAAWEATGLAPIVTDPDSGEPIPLEDIASEPEIEIVVPGV